MKAHTAAANQLHRLLAPPLTRSGRAAVGYLANV
jgi:hypothetical protein